MKAVVGHFKNWKFWQTSDTGSMDLNAERHFNAVKNEALKNPWPKKNQDKKAPWIFNASASSYSETYFWDRLY
jgi:hypothetical protein